MRRIIAAMLVLLAAACGGSSSSDFTCSLGPSMTGTWTAHYTETNGNCGAISDETVIASDPSSMAGCTLNARDLSADRCHESVSSTCPLRSQTISGTQAWTMVVTQDSATHIGGTATVQVVASAGSCRSTYNVSISKM